MFKSFGTLALGECHFDENKFGKLKCSARREIIFAGINVELFFGMLFFIVSLVSWFYIKSSFVWYYLNVTFLTLLPRICINFFGKGSDGEKLRGLKRKC